MNNNHYLTQITNYVFDSRYPQALLIDGDWGCGKTHFVRNDLIREIEKHSTGTPDGVPSVYKSIMVSLYGLSSIESIYNNLYSALLEKYLPKSWGQVSSRKLAMNKDTIKLLFLSSFFDEYGVRYHQENLRRVVIF